MNLDRLTDAQIRDSLRCEASPTRDVPFEQDGHDRKAGVLMPLLRERDAWHLLYIRRSESQHDHHSGQVAFAGGKWEPGDRDLEQTALREAHEEIGIVPGDVRVLGRLGRHHSVTRFSITPVVGVIPWPYRLQPDPSEVASVFTMPLAWLADPGNLEITHRRIAGYAEPVPVASYRRYEGELLWGATARMTITFIEQLRRYLEGRGSV
jgi:8-oxo-dGTP pyrophosphatase MutT (NUDIX family)